jgi:hypothetical protein
MLMRSPLAREQSPAGFIRPTQPVLADRPPSGPGWSFEIKHEGFRIVSRKDGERVRLWSRNGRDWSVEFRAIAEAVRSLPFSGVILDGEAVAHCDKAHPSPQPMENDGDIDRCRSSSAPQRYGAAESGARVRPHPRKPHIDVNLSRVPQPHAPCGKIVRAEHYSAVCDSLEGAVCAY